MNNHCVIFHRVRMALVCGVVWACTTSDALGATPGAAGEAQQRSFIVGLTIVAALVAGLVMYNLSRRVGKTRYQEATKKRAPVKKVTSFTDRKQLVPAIAAELSQLKGSGTQRQDVAQMVSELVTRTIEDEVDDAKQALTAQHAQELEEQRRSGVILQRKYQAAIAEKKQTNAVMSSIAEGLVVVNTKGEVVMMNPAAKGLLAMDQKGGSVGTPLLDSLDDKQLVSLVSRSNDRAESREIVLSAKEESTKRILRASNAMITDENGETVGMVSVLSDVTKQRELDQLKADFVSKVSHELRTPIVAMQHALAILRDQVAGNLNEEQQKFVELSQRNLERLHRLISDLLDLSKLEAQKMEMIFRVGPIAPVVQQVCESLAPWAKSKAVALSRRIADDIPDARFDQARIIQVLTNLVGNSIKFTPRQGRILIEAKRAEKEDAIEVSVSDTGPGISQEDLPKLFGRFQQVGERSATDISGTGLGLSISKEIVDLHNGRIWADPKQTKGARFVFTLPLAQKSSEA